MNPPLKGQIAPGNINLVHRPQVPNPEGGISTVLSMSFGTPEGEILIPRVVNGKILSPEEAMRHYDQTGEHLGKFNNVPDAEEMGQAIHMQQATEPMVDLLMRAFKF